MSFWGREVFERLFFFLMFEEFLIFKNEKRAGQGTGISDF